MPQPEAPKRYRFAIVLTPVEFATLRRKARAAEIPATEFLRRTVEQALS